MLVKDLQQQMVELLAQWDAQRNMSPSEQHSFTHLIEEVGELARQYVSKEARPDQYDEAEITDSLGDIMFGVVRIAHIRGLDIEKVITNIIERDSQYFRDIKNEASRSRS